MYYIGIDISKFKHDCAVVDGDGVTVTPSWSFYCDREGFDQLKRLLDSLEGEKRIGFEATGHYGETLKLYLESNSFTFMEFNPLLVKRFVAGKSLRRTKSDPIDALYIAQYLMSVEYKPYPVSFYHIKALKSLTRFRSSLIKQRSRQLVAMTTVLDVMFPEFKPFFGGKFSATALYILDNYTTPQHIANMNAKSFDILRKKSRGHFTADKFARLKELAKKTIGHSSEYLESELKITLDIYTQMDARVEQIEDEIEKLVSDMNPMSLSVPGIGVMTIAEIIGECGDFKKFENPSKILAFAGMEPGYHQSGTVEHSGKMVKHGSPYLRNALMCCVMPVIHNNLVFAEYYDKKIKEGKSHNTALSHCAKKLLRVIYALETKQIPFDASKLR